VNEVWDATGDPAMQWLHVQCVEPVTNTEIRDFVIMISERERSTRFLNLGTAALLSGRTMVVMFESTDVLTCGPNCRTPRFFGLKR
jgi:hypothetical protein